MAPAAWGIRGAAVRSGRRPKWLSVMYGRDEGRQLEAQINEAGGEALFLRLDVTREEDWQSAVSATVSRFGKLDVLVNNAGIGGGGRLEHTALEDWNRMMDINAKGVFLGTKTAIPAMRETGGGSIVNISSIWGMVGAEMSSPMYQASKGAVRLLTKTLRYSTRPTAFAATQCIPAPSPRPSPRPAATTRSATASCWSAPPWDATPSHRGGLRSPLPSLRRVLLRHRQRTRHRRRLDSAVALQASDPHSMRSLFALTLQRWCLGDLISVRVQARVSADLASCGTFAGRGTVGAPKHERDLDSC